jgi:hypothetical protein
MPEPIPDPFVFPCLYCKNPRPEITFPHTNNSGYAITTPTTKLLPSASINGTDTQEVHGPPKVKCDFCRKEYILLAKQDDTDFFNFTLSKLKMHSSLFAAMAKRKLDVDDIEHGFIGITKPLVSFYKLTEKNQSHILFGVKKKIYYLICRRNNEGILVATGVEVVD